LLPVLLRSPSGSRLPIVTYNSEIAWFFHSAGVEFCPLNGRAAASARPRHGVKVRGASRPTLQFPPPVSPLPPLYFTNRVVRAPASGIDFPSVPLPLTCLPLSRHRPKINPPLDLIFVESRDSPSNLFSHSPRGTPCRVLSTPKRRPPETRGMVSPLWKTCLPIETLPYSFSTRTIRAHLRSRLFGAAPKYRPLNL